MLLHGSKMESGFSSEKEKSGVFQHQRSFAGNKRLWIINQQWGREHVLYLPNGLKHLCWAYVGVLCFVLVGGCVHLFTTAGILPILHWKCVLVHARVRERERERPAMILLYLFLTATFPCMHRVRPLLCQTILSPLQHTTWIKFESLASVIGTSQLQKKDVPSPKSREKQRTDWSACFTACNKDGSSHSDIHSSIR